MEKRRARDEGNKVINDRKKGCGGEEEMKFVHVQKSHSQGL
jgi:hypothetical protein